MSDEKSPAQTFLARSDCYPRRLHLKRERAGSAMVERMSDSPTLEFRISRTRLQQSYLLGALLIAIGSIVFLIGHRTIPDATLIAVAHLLIGGGVIAYGYRQAREGKARLILDPDGIWYRDWRTRPVPWQQVRSISAAGSRMNSFIAIEVRDAETLLHIIPAADRDKFKANRLVRLPKLFIPNNCVDAPFDELIKTMNARLEQFGG
jgi:hypothetical protein